MNKFNVRSPSFGEIFPCLVMDECFRFSVEGHSCVVCNTTPSGDFDCDCEGYTKESIEKHCRDVETIKESIDNAVSTAMYKLHHDRSKVLFTPEAAISLIDQMIKKDLGL